MRCCVSIASRVWCASSMRPGPGRTRCSNVPELCRKRSPANDLPLGPYSLASQFSNAIFTAPCDAVILSIQPDVTMSLMRHRRDGFLFYPIGAEAWPAGDRAWLQSNYEASGLLSVEAAMNNLAAIVAKIREHSEFRF